MIVVQSDSFASPWTGACQAPLSVGFLKQEYWNGLPFPSRMSPEMAGRFFTTEPLGKLK